MKRFLVYGLLFSLAACGDQAVIEVALPASRSLKPVVEKESMPANIDSQWSIAHGSAFRENKSKIPGDSLP